MFEGGQRSTWVGRFSSAFRSRTTQLSPAVAAEVVAAWDQLLAKGGSAIRAEQYWDALPFTPPRPDTERAGTHQRLLAEARGETSPPAVAVRIESQSAKPTTKRRVCCR